jgi:RHS repeat-associated protein
VGRTVKSVVVFGVAGLLGTVVWLAAWPPSRLADVLPHSVWFFYTDLVELLWPVSMMGPWTGVPLNITHDHANAARGEKSHQGIFSKNRRPHVSPTWVKWSGTHQVIEWCASRTVLGPTIYLYDVDNLLEEVDNSGNVLARYTPGSGVDHPLAELRSGTTGYYQQDGIDSVTSLSTLAGALTNTYTYDSFGKLTASTGTLTNPFQYTGREFSSETNLYYYRARYYDPSLGRFLSEDPMGFFAGPDFYAYVRNRPTLYSDPTGLNPAVGVLPWLGGIGSEGVGAAAAAGAGAGVAVAGAGAMGWGIGRGIGHIPIGNGQTVDDAVTAAFASAILALSKEPSCSGRTRRCRFLFSFYDPGTDRSRQICFYICEGQVRSTVAPAFTECPKTTYLPGGCHDRFRNALVPSSRSGPRSYL